MAFDIKKDQTKWIIAGTGSGWQLIPAQTDRIVFCLNDYIYFERYHVKPDLLCIMDVLDEKPQIVTGINDLGDVVARINKMRISLISPFKYEEIPLSVAFPLEKAAQVFGIPYFTNTICYMIAYAIMNGARDIQLYGVNQASSSEYFYEKAGVEYWLGIANGMGIKITINGDKSEVLANKARFGGNLLYGYNQTYDEFINFKKKFGAPTVKRLFTHQQPKNRTIRKVNYGS